MALKHWRASAEVKGVLSNIFSSAASAVAALSSCAAGTAVLQSVPFQMFMAPVENECEMIACVVESEPAACSLRSTAHSPTMYTAMFSVLANGEIPIL